ncbi:MAG: anhydro-N-acetylmuramic acid kinase [Gemmatimonadota bacterium]
MALYVGVMSGTSLDGIDVAVVEFEGEEERPDRSRLAGFATYPYEPAFRERLRRACSASLARELCTLSFELGERFATAVLDGLRSLGVDPRTVEGVGSHGQTVWHEPPEAGGRGSGDGWRGGGTLQIGEPSLIAERTGISVVADFRVRDLAAGGQGAPLTAYFDRLLLTSGSASRVVVNLGGIGNLTALPREDDPRAPLAFDTGPGVALLDAAAARLTREALHMDEGGRLAARGRVCEAALAEWWADPFFRTPPPRSTGRERFSESRLESWLAAHEELGTEDALATLTELTARAVTEAFRWIPFEVGEVYLCGGGARNLELRRRITERLAPRPVADLAELGWDPDAREAVAFALLARQHLAGIPVACGWATGAGGPRILGKRVPA